MEDDMKQARITFVVLLFSCFSIFAQTTIFPGNVSGTWSLLNSPYWITGDITIPDDSTLLIEPGVMVEFQGYYALNVQGRLLAVGTALDTIVFTVNDTLGFHNPDTSLGGWNGIQFIDTPMGNDSSKITYCRLQYGKAVGTSPPDNNGGAIYISNFHKVFISNCLITRNSAGGLNSPSGGGVSIFFSNVSLEENEISHNRAWDGGAIIIYESDAVFLNNHIVSNHAVAGGGGIWIGGLSNPQFNGDIYLNNISESNGGGIICWQTTNTILNAVTFTGNFANWGGGVGVIDCEMQLNNCTLDDNSAISLGGGLASDFSNVNLSNTIFMGDTAGYLSGAIHAWYSDITIKHAVFEDNEADFGGAIHSDFSDIQIDSSTFRRNLAIDGAGIHSLNTNLSVDSCLFSQNQASNIGGGIQYHVDTTEYINPYQIEILNSRFVQNSAFLRGTLEVRQLNSQSSLVNVIIDRTEFIGNSTDRGGNLFITGFIEDFTISNSIFQANTAALRTANCLFTDHVNGQVANCLFVSNQTPGGGSASAITTGANIDFINSTFFDNLGGAVITHRNDGHSSLLNNIFWSNRPYNIIMNAVTDTTPCTIDITYSDLEFGLDSIQVNDTISTVNWGVGNIDQYPLFADTAGFDFHLQDTSGCIGAGIDSLQISGVWHYSPLVDFEGNPRPDPPGSMPDMGAYESPLAVPSAISDLGHHKPLAFSLKQNYPNPFNPRTTIAFDIPKTSQVTLKIYNILGEEVTTLLSASLLSGSYKYEWDASSLASGVYLYRLEAEKYVETRKMVLLK
jgi:hypothetical protein